MSSPEERAIVAPTRRAVLGGLACLAALPLAGCLRPLYGTAASNVEVSELLRRVSVDPVKVDPGEEVLAHYLRQELVFALDGTGRPTVEGPRAYALAVEAGASVRLPIVDAVTLRASVASLVGRASYTLTSADGGTVVDSATVNAVVTYERTAQRFAAVRAGREARIRLAKRLAEEIRTRVAIALRAAPEAAPVPAVQAPADAPAPTG
ncbi:LPS assembly lipoprotein LptE [Salinarimonas rosea]|uniref:LPS assembly lipoprotein LptE n=1 Tax=Salinarimonas rosea TaxID=552063 RepID=UPI0003F73B94|nr:LPS assembly lipoprotein LptE [Salinarimonas rosea]